MGNGSKLWAARAGTGPRAVLVARPGRCAHTRRRRAAIQPRARLFCAGVRGMRFRGARGNGNCPRRRALDGLLGLSRSLRCCYSMATAQDKAVGEMGTMRAGRLATAAGGRRGLPGCMSAPAAMPQPLWQASLKGRDHGAAAGWMGWRSCLSAPPSHHLSGVFVRVWALLARLFGRVAQKRVSLSALVPVRSCAGLIGSRRVAEPRLGVSATLAVTHAHGRVPQGHLRPHCSCASSLSQSGGKGLVFRLRWSWDQ